MPAWNLRPVFCSLTCASILATWALSGCATSSNGRAVGADLAQRQLTWAIAHGGGCDCNPASFAPGDAGAIRISKINVENYASEFRNSCHRPEVLITGYGDGTADVAPDLELAHSRASALVRALSGKRRWQIDSIWFGGPHVGNAATATAWCLTEPMPRGLRAPARAYDTPAAQSASSKGFQ
jgi:hypothetical protein